MSSVVAALHHARPARALRWAIPAAVALLALPWVLSEFYTIGLAYGLTMAIAALGFNLLLGYTGLLSFGHSAYFGLGAYVVALMVKYLKITSMELFLVGAVVGTVIVTAVFGFACVRYTRIFFGILTLALSQVLWSLAFKFFWFTGGTDGLRVPTPTLLGFMTVLGGFRSFFGPVIGAIVFNFLKTWAVGYTTYWQFLLGAVLVVLVLSLPTGIVGTAGRLWARLREEK